MEIKGTSFFLFFADANCSRTADSSAPQTIEVMTHTTLEVNTAWKNIQLDVGTGPRPPSAAVPLSPGQESISWGRRLLPTGKLWIYKKLYKRSEKQGIRAIRVFEV